jgi:hypothetical protein
MVAEFFRPTPTVDLCLKPTHFINKARRQLGQAAREGIRRLLTRPNIVTRCAGGDDVVALWLVAARSGCIDANLVTRRAGGDEVVAQWKTAARSGNKQYQKEFANQFKIALLPCTLVSLLSARFKKHFAGLCSQGFEPSWETTLRVLQSAQTHFAMAALKTLLNSWCTQGRYHDSSADLCIFGCAGAVDDILHYACCQRLWQASAEAAQMPLSASVEERLLLLYPARERLDVMVIAFSVYHAVKLGHPAAVSKAQESSDYGEVHFLMASVAKAHAIKFDIGQREAQKQDVAAGSLARSIEAAPAGVATPPATARMPPGPLVLLPSSPGGAAATLQDAIHGEAAPVTPQVVCFPATPEW